MNEYDNYSGQVASKAYCEAVGNGTYDDKPIPTPTWNDLPEKVKLAWRAAAHAVIVDFDAHLDAAMSTPDDL